MRLQYAQEVVRGLDAGSNKRLEAYKSNLRSDKDRVVFDDRVLRELEPFVRDQADFQKTRAYLKGIGYTSSKYEYAQIQKALLRFTEPEHPYFGWNEHYRRAKELMIREFQRFDLQMLQYKADSSIVDAIPREDTHAGFSFIITGKRKKGEYLDGIHAAYSLEEATAKRVGSFNKPILIGSRTQVSGAFDGENDYEFTHTFKSKTRLVSMIDIYQILAELRFAKPLQAKLASQGWYAGGKDDVMMNGVIQSLRHEKGFWLTLDYSAYDQSISSWLIRDAFDIIRRAFYYDIRFDESLFDVVVNDFVNKVFIDGDGQLVPASKGVPSGSMFTQIVDSIVNRLMLLTYFFHKGIPLNRTAMMIMGDDNIIFTSEKLDECDVSNYISHNFGITVNSDKAKCGDKTQNPEFLSRWWTPNGSWRHRRELMAKMLYPERFRDYQKTPGPDPVLIVYAYILTYAAGMRELIDVDRFKISKLAYLRKATKADLEWLPGYWRYRERYS
nr:MAG: putative RNA-dependent RNA polymerase [Partitiviridae sp.]